MIPSNELLVAYNYDSWYGYNQKEPIQKDVTVKNNSHTLICGMSGSGKSYFTIQYIARIFKTGGNNSVVYFGDFKQDDAFICLRKCSRYYAYNKTLDALNEVYSILKRRQIKKSNYIYLGRIYGKYFITSWNRKKERTGCNAKSFRNLNDW